MEPSNHAIRNGYGYHESLRPHPETDLSGSVNYTSRNHDIPTSPLNPPPEAII